LSRQELTLRATLCEFNLQSCPRDAVVAIVLEHFQAALKFRSLRFSQGKLRTVEAVKPFASLLLRKIVTAFQGVLTPFDGLDKAVFLFQITGNNVLNKLIRLAPLLGGSLRQAGLQVGVETYFHGLKIVRNVLGCKRCAG